MLLFLPTVAQAPIFMSLCRTRAIHMEFLHDHARIERMFFEGFCEPQTGVMKPGLSRRLGIGLELKEKDAAAYLVS